MVKGRVAYRESDGSLQRVWAQCDRYGKPRHSKDPTDQRKRPNRGSRKCECKMEASIMETYRGSGIWQFKVVEAIHNHDPSKEPGAHPVIREMHKNDDFLAMVAAHKSAGIPAKDTLTAQLIERPTLPLITRRTCAESQYG
jgi:hypothetical protein